MTHSLRPLKHSKHPFKTENALQPNSTPKPPTTKSKGRARPNRQGRITQTKGIGTSTKFSATMPFAPSMRVSLRYAETHNFTTGTAGVAGTEQVMRLNDLYDTNLTGTGHQPYGYDQMVALYNRWRVDRVRITFLWSTIGGSAELALLHLLRTATGGLTMLGQTVDRLTEIPMIKTAILSSSGNSRTRKVVVEANIWDILGISKNTYVSDVDRYSGSTNASPAVTPFSAHTVASYSLVAGESATCQIILDYDCLFWDRQVLSQS